MTEEGRRTGHAVPHQVGPAGGIDQAIDRVVFEMMEVDADTAFRARVLARLARPTPVTWWRTAAVSAAAALLVLAVLVFRPGAPGPDTTTATSTLNPPGTVAENPATGVLSVPVRVPPREGRRVAAGPARATAVVPAAPLNVSTSVPAGMVVATVAEAEPGAALEPLHPIEPIAIQPLQPEAITPPAIVIAPLAPIAEVQIAPLSQPIDRN